MDELLKLAKYACPTDLVNGAPDQDTQLKFLQGETGRQIYLGAMKAVQQQACKSFTDAFKRGKLDALHPIIQDIRLMNDKKVERFMWVTVNPEAERDPKLLFKLVHKWCKRKQIISAAYCFEQGGTNSETVGHHPHAHILMEHNMHRSDFLRNIRNTFKQLGNVEKDYMLNIRVCHEDHLMRRYNYVTGHKKLIDDKETKAKMDELWRAQMMIENFYEKGLVKNLVKNPLGVIQEESSDSDEDMD